MSFVPYLSDFAWIILSKNFAQQHLSFSLGTVPVVLRVQRYIFFLSLQHFFKIFFTFLKLFYFPLKDRTLQRRNFAPFLKILGKTGILRPYHAFYDTEMTEKYHKSTKIPEKPMRFRVTRTGTGTSSGTGTGTGDGDGRRGPKVAASARRRSSFRDWSGILCERSDNAASKDTAESPTA